MWGLAACRWCIVQREGGLRSSTRDRIWVVNIAGIDEIRLGLTESTDLEDEIANFDIRYEGWRSATGFNWQRTFGSRGVGLLGITHSEAKVGQQVKDLVSQGAAAGCAPEVVIAEPVVYFEDSREGETTIKYDLTVHVPSSTRCRPAAASRRSASTTRRNRPTATTRHARRCPASTRSSRHALPVVSDRRLPAGLEAGGLARERHAGRTLRPLRILSQARFSPRAGVNVRLTDTLSWNSSAGSYYQQPAFLFVSAFPRTRRSCPGARPLVTAWPGRPCGSRDGRGVRKTYTTTR